MADKPPTKKKPGADRPAPKSPPSPDIGSPGDEAVMGSPPLGARPPMPGEGVDPYAALMGQISPSPAGIGMPPMGGGMPPMGGGMPPMGGGMPPMGGGMSPMGIGSDGGLAPPSGMVPGLNLPGMTPTPDMGQDQMAQALLGGGMPPGPFGEPDMDDQTIDPGQVGAQGYSLNQLLQLLALAQGGIPTSGVQPPSPSRSVASGLNPGYQGTML